MVGGQASGKRKAEHFEPLDLREGKSPSHSKQTNEHSAPLFVRKQAQGPKWYLRGEKKKKIKSLYQQDSMPGANLLSAALSADTLPVARGPLHHAGDLCCLQNRASQFAGYRQHPALERTGSLPGSPPHPQQQVSDRVG